MLSPLGFSLLRRLADGEVHSGEALAAASGISRARVSQLLREVDAAGVTLERRRGRGYRLPDPLPFLAREAIVAALGTRAAQLAIDVADSIDSTNSELARRASVGSIHGHLLVAEWQTAGRGRRGRGWSAAIGGSLSFSLGWRFERGAGFLSGLPLAVGLAVVQALEADSFHGVGLKWPNDIIHDQKKLGGILVELSGDALGPSLAIIGVGLNVRLPAKLRREIAQPATDLAAIAPARTIDRNALLARIAVELLSVLAIYANEGFAPFRAAWQRRHALQKKPVRIVLPDGGAVRGEVVGVDADGALILDSAGRRSRYVSGEVSLRRA